MLSPEGISTIEEAPWHLSNPLPDFKARTNLLPIMCASAHLTGIIPVECRLEQAKAALDMT
jgi:hypothetical protein